MVETRAELAIFGLVSRPPGTRQNRQDALTHAGYHFDRLAAGTELAWIGNLQSARLESVLRLRAPGDAEGSGFGLGLFLTVERSTAAPESYTLLSIGLTVGFGWEL